MESLYWKDISFLTLTYNDENLPYNIVDSRLVFNEEDLQDHPELKEVYYPTLRARDLQLFIKRLRKFGFGEEHNFSDFKWPDCKVERRKGFKFFGVGEYGTLKGRPHLHILLFGIAPTEENAVRFQEIWNKGFVNLRPAFPETCKYIAGYVQKKLYGSESKSYLKLPEFLRCSQHLGQDWIVDNISIFDDEHQYIPFKGKDGKSYPHGIPRTFRKFLVEQGRLSPFNFEDFYNLQLEDGENFHAYLESLGLSFTEFMRARRKEAEHIEELVLSKRKLTGDI